MIDLALFAVFLSSVACGLWLVNRKVQLLLQLSDELINQSLAARPSRLKTWTRPVVEFFQDEEYKDLYYGFLLRMIRRSRILLLRLERVSFHLVQSLQARTKELSKTEERYWHELKSWKRVMKRDGASLPKEVLNPEAPVDRSTTANSSPDNFDNSPR